MTKFLISDADIEGLNRRAVEQSAAFARRAATALVVVGAVLALAWLWTTIRLQWRVDSSGGCRSGSASISGMIITGPCVRAVDRVDLLAGSLGGLWSPASALTLGFAVRVLADGAVARTGGSVTGFAVGDEVDASEELGDGDLADDDAEGARGEDAGR